MVMGQIQVVIQVCQEVCESPRVFTITAEPAVTFGALHPKMWKFVGSSVGF